MTKYWLNCSSITDPLKCLSQLRFNFKKNVSIFIFLCIHAQTIESRKYVFSIWRSVPRWTKHHKYISHLKMCGYTHYYCHYYYILYSHVLPYPAKCLIYLYNYWTNYMDCHESFYRHHVVDMLQSKISIGWIVSGIYCRYQGPLRMNINEFSDLQTFPLVPLAGKSFHSCEISQLLYGLSAFIFINLWFTDDVSNDWSTDFASCTTMETLN